MSSCSALFLKYMNERANAQRDKMDVAEVRAKYSDAELQAMGDKSPFYRYVV